MRFAAALATLMVALAATAAAAVAAPLDLRELGDSFLRFDGEIYSAPGAEVEEGDTSGDSVAGDCDVTGDGVPDIVVAAPSATVGTQPEAGRIYVAPGEARTPGSYSLPAAAGQTAAGALVIAGSPTGVSRKLGSPLACAGDVNGDGADDIVAAAGEGSSPAAVYVIFGGPALVAAGQVAIDSLGSHGFKIEGGVWLGFAVAGLGDLNGDGKDEIAVGDPWGHFDGREYVGAVSVVAGRTGSTAVDVSVPGSTLMQIGGVEGDEVGSVAAAGDVDGDGVGDLVVGAPTHAGPNGVGSGAAYVVSGNARGAVDVDAYAGPASSVLFPIWGASSQRTLGRTLAGVGDVDGDGLDDLAVAEGRARTDSGGAFFQAVQVVYGKDDGAPVDTAKLRSGGFTVSGRHDPNAGDEFGAALAGAGDVNGDGHADIAIGAPSFYNPVEPGKGPAAGAAYLIYGGSHPVDADVASLSCEQGAEVWGSWTEGLGRSIDAAGDFNGDDPQLLIGATRFVKEGNGHYALVVPLAGLADGCEGEEPPPVSGDNPEADWGFRENFRRYVSNGFDAAKPAVPISTAAGAFCPPNPDTVKGGCDPLLKVLPADPVKRGALRFTPVGAGATDGTDTTIATQGRVSFRYPGHFFTLELEDPWFAIAGNEVTVRARMDLDVDPSFTAYQSADVRVDLGTFPLAGPAEVTSDYVRWETGAGILTPAASTALGNFLGSGAELDPVTLTIPRSLAALPAEPGAPALPDPVDDPNVNKGLGGTTTTTVIATPAPTAAPAPLKGRAVGNDGIARLGQLSCKTEGCAVKVPRRVAVKIDGQRFWAKVLAPKLIGKGQKRPLRVRLPKASLTRLNGRATTLRVRVVVRSGRCTLVRVMSVKVRYVPGARQGKVGGPAGPAAGPKSTPITTAEPPTLARPASAVEVSNVKVTWFPRDSWVRYASSGVGAGDGIKLGNGAVGTKSKASQCPDRPSTSDAELDYQVDFAPKPSWYDPVSGSAGVYGQGSVAFKWAAHTIDLTASDPEIEIAGPASRAIFRFSGSGGTPYPNQRASLVSLDTAGRPAVSNGGRTFTYSLMRGTLTADGVNVFAGFYTPPDNDEFGCVSVAFTTP